MHSILGRGVTKPTSLIRKTRNEWTLQGCRFYTDRVIVSTFRQHSSKMGIPMKGMVNFWRQARGKGFGKTCMENGVVDEMENVGTAKRVAGKERQGRVFADGASSSTSSLSSLDSKKKEVHEHVGTLEEAQFDIISETPSYQRYLTVYNRRVRYPSTGTGNAHNAGLEVEYDVIGHPKSNFQYAVVFPYHPGSNKEDWQDGEVTLIKEYCQGVNEVMYSLPAGAFDATKHKTPEDCAWAELNEEAHLKGGKMYPVLDANIGVPEVKWCRNVFTPFIVIDPASDENPSNRDTEEWIEIERMDIKTLRKAMKSGKMLLPSVTTCFWAFDWLEENYHNCKA